MTDDPKTMAVVHWERSLMFRLVGDLVYQRVARPLLFCLSGDTAHSLMPTLVRILDALCWGWYFLTLGPIRIGIGLWLQRAATEKDDHE